MDRNNVSDYDLYMSIIDEVVSDVHNDFIEGGKNEADLQAFKDLWKDKLIKSKVVDPENTPIFTGKPRQQIRPRLSSIAAPEPKSLDFLLNYRVSMPQTASRQTSSKSTPAGQITVLGQQKSPLGGQFQSIGNVTTVQNLLNLRLPVKSPEVFQRQVSSPQTATRPKPSESRAIRNLLNVRISPYNPRRIAKGTKQTGTNGKVIIIPPPKSFPTRGIGQFDGPSDVGFMDDDDDDDDDYEDDCENFDNHVAESLQLYGNEETGSPSNDSTDNNDEVHDIDDENAPTMDDYEEIFDCENVINCKFAQVMKRKGRFKISLTSGILLFKGKEYVFGMANGEAHMSGLE